MLKSSAETAARNEAKECIEKQLPGMLTSELVAEAIRGDAKIIPMIASAVNQANDDMQLTSDDADEIASSLDEERRPQ